MKVKSVYNFVPAPKESEVFKPDWAEQVSHDIPFSDGESGEIEIKIKAETPIFIRNGHTKEDAELFRKTLEDKEFKPSEEEQKKIDRHLSFSNYKGKYFIPATSLKGMFRNVLEIITNSRMILEEGAKEKNEDVFGMRDMYNQQYKNDNKNVQSGWLIKENDNWIIKPCINHRISLKEIEKEFNLRHNSLKSSGVSKNKLCEEEIKNKLLSFSLTKDLGEYVGKQYSIDPKGDFKGYIVLYGDIDNKRYDYIFGEPDDDEFIVDKSLVEILDSIESNAKKADAKYKSLWYYFKKNYKKIPVFFTLKRNSNFVKHFGLTKLYRRNNSHYLNEIEPFKSYLNSDGLNELDFAELLFGSVRTENALKGRVFISHAWSKDAEVGRLRERILNSPKPSYYLAYIEQEGREDKPGKLKKHYSTYHDKNAELRGFKRYPIHSSIKPNIESDNENLASQFIPIKKGIFEGKIRYFNLKPQELGALISAITFHGNSDKFFHSIGGAKPYGFGKIKVKISSSIDVNHYLKAFEDEIDKHLEKVNKDEFVKNENIIELLSIATQPSDDDIDKLLNYPLLETEKFKKDRHGNLRKVKVNEFNEYKKEQIYLEKYSERNEQIKIRSIAERLKPQELLDLSQYSSFNQLKRGLPKDLERLEEFSDENKSLILDKLMELSKSHKKSANDIIKKYHKEKLIPGWLGPEKAKALYDKLTS